MDTNDKYGDCVSYEMSLPDDFDVTQFVRAAKSGVGDFWLVCFDDEEGILRFKGVYRKTGDRCILDIIPESKVAHTPHKETYALEIARSLKATNVYKDGAELTNYKKQSRRTNKRVKNLITFNELL